MTIDIMTMSYASDLKQKYMNVWNYIQEKHCCHVDVILLYVLASTGSSPGRQGFKMAVGADCTFTGSIGGGIMEHKFVEMAKAILAETAVHKKEVYKQVHSKDDAINQSGMICSGEQTIFLHKVTGRDMIAVEKILRDEKDNLDGTLLLSPEGIDYAPEAAADNFSYEKSEDSFLLKEKTGFKNTLHIIGGGHCALALSQLMRQMDFYIHLYDDRKDLDTIKRNSFVHEIHLLNSFSDVESFIGERGNVFVVIMTFGYRTDDLAVRSLFNKKLTYIGILGSTKKMEQMFKAYREEGVAEEIIKRLHAPIGVQIKSQTPAEIAISIAAEIIKVKNKAY